MDFKPSRLLANRHLQTLYPALFHRNIKLPFEIETFTLSDGDFVDCYWLGRDASKPIVIVFHGLGGSYRSGYIGRTMQTLSHNGFSTVLMHFRGCSGRINIHPRAYHSGDTGDALEWIEEVFRRYKGARVHLIGFSLGANMLLKLLGTHKLPIASAIAISPPLDLVLCADRINSGFSRFYQSIMIQNLNRFVLQKFQHHDYEKLIGLKKHEVTQIKTFWEFDERYTAPIHGFDNAKHYYEDSSALYYLPSITTPTLLIMAQDDPVTCIDFVPPNLSSSIKVEFPTQGGHVGFVGGGALGVYWLSKRIAEYLLNK
ncbi:MAG: hypothetical protein KU28_11255 [Sulfurovum sp. PC08-66]|nr:MAG: hypothetical protein KU28_11255 [Sulfurovum sp. PC08-66]